MATQTTTPVTELKINRLTKALYNDISTPSDSELYIVTDEQVDYSDLTNKPTIGNATLTIQKNGTTVNTFTANASSNVTANITVPTKISDLTNDSNFANTDLSNLSSTGKNISNWSTNVSNCITEIPQDIKLELNNGTLTLKAGSKVYVPNGSGVFDVVNITTDKITTASANGKWAYFINKSGNLQRWTANECFSGTTAPTSIHYPMWYDTTNNAIKSSDDYGSTWSGKFSLPIAIVTVSNGAISSIDQVFNGFGYIGSTIFALPGVKGLMPSGRNADGTLNNTAFTVNNVITRTTSYDFNSQCALIMRDTGIDYVKKDFYLESEKTPALKQYARLYQSTENQMYYGEASAWAKISAFNFGSMTIDSSGKITSFSTKTPFHAVDYSDFQKTAEQTNTNTTNIATLGTSKANTSLNNVSAGIDFVIESQEPTAENDYMWYRKYKSGWVEQGGVSIAIADYETATITLPVAMSNINYTLTFGNGWDGTNDDGAYIGAYCERLPNRTTTSFQLYGRGATQRKISFVVSGKAA